MHNLKRLITNEWLKLMKKRSFWVPYALLIAASVLAGYPVHTYAPEMFGSVHEFSRMMLQTRGLGQVITLLAIIGSSGMVAREYSRGTIKFLLIRSHSRTAIGISMLLLMLDKVIIHREFYKYMLFPNLDWTAYWDEGAPLPGMTSGFSAAVLSAYMLVFLITGFVVFQRRDVA